MKKTRTAALFLLTLSAVIAAGGGPEDCFAGQNRETILRIHGSNTVGAQLAPDLAAALLKKLGADSVKKIEITPGVETNVEGHFSAADQTKVIEVRAHGSSTAFSCLKNGTCDIGMASRKIKEDEAQSLADLGDMTGSGSEHVLAMDGVAVIVNTANTAAAKMDFTALADVFSGKIANWSQLGGKDAPIAIHARDEKSGTHDTFQSIVLGKRALAASAVRYESNEALSAAVSADVNAIGYCGLPYVKHNKVLAIADGASPVRPTVFTVATEDYPVSRRLYLYAPAPQENTSYAQQFIAFALGSEGQTQVKQHRFIDLTIAAEEFAVEMPDDSSPQIAKYLSAVRGAQRLSANFRFKGETLELDNRALRDIERMAIFLAGNKEITTLVLAGFSDRQAGMDSTQTLDLSCKRAEAVKAAALKSLPQGVKISDVLCVGDAVPVASNDSERGREKNRRVEVWVK
jgi:phosphate transport system substrate-binding protein